MERISADSWKLYDLGNLVPKIVQQRVGQVLRTEWLSNNIDEPIVRLVRELFGETATIEVTSVYYDHGMGAVGVRVRFETLGQQNIDKFVKKSEVLRETLQTWLSSGSFVNELSCLQSALWAVCTEEKYLRPCIFDQPTQLSRRPGYFLDTFGMGLRIRRGSGGVECNKARIEELAAAFCGREVSFDKMKVEGDCPIWSWSGYRGSIAIMPPAGGVHANLELYEKKIAWLWSLLAMHWGTLYEISELVYDAMGPLVDTDQIDGQIDRYRDIEVCVACIEQEADPVTLCGSPLEEAVYGTLWEAWRGPALMSSIDRLIKKLNDYLKIESRSRTNRYQHRIERQNVAIQWLLAPLGAAGVAGTLAEVVGLHQDKPVWAWFLFGLMVLLIAALALLLTVMSKANSEAGD